MSPTAQAINVVPISLRLLGFFPENGSEALFWIMLVAGFFETIFSWCSISAAFWAVSDEAVPGASSGSPTAGRSWSEAPTIGGRPERYSAERAGRRGGVDDSLRCRILNSRA